MDLLARVDRWAAQCPHRTAHLVEGKALAWVDLVLRSDALAAAIARLSLPPGSPIVVRGHKESEMVIGFLGCAKAGHPYVPVDIGTPEARFQKIIATAGAELVLTPDTVRELAAQPGTRPERSVTSDTPLYVMFTSGSTGEPKGVIITHGCIEAFLDWMMREQQFAGAGEVFLNQALFSFDLSVMDTWNALVTGGTLVSLTSSDIGNFGRLFPLLEGAMLTTWVSTPQFAQLCLAEPRFNGIELPMLRRFLFCGDVLTPDVARSLIERFPAAAVWNTYGPTEATVATTSVRVTQQMLDLYPQLPVGAAMQGTTINLIDVVDDRGEVVITGPNVALGYFGRPDLTRRSFSTNDGVRSYRTGDLGSFRDGMLFFHGRIDHQVKIAGHRIEIGDVESHLASLPNVTAAAVVPIVRRGHVDSLEAYVVLRSASALSPFETSTALRTALTEWLPAYMVPRKIHVIERMPLTPNGKTDRAALTARLGA